MVQCATDPEVETNLCCSRCGKPICPKCLVQTPVGARCRDCAQLRRLPIYQVSPTHYLIAIAVALAGAVGGGIIWGFIPLGGLLAIFIALGVGYVLGEAISVSVNRKQGRGLQVIAGISVFLAYVTSRLAPAAISLYNSVGPTGSATPFLGDLFSRVLLASVLDPIGLVIVAFGVIVAVKRLG